LSQAARELGMSYRRAWLLIDDLNRSLEKPVVTSATGGKHGGGAQLTATGRALARSYRGFERRAETMAVRAFAAFTASGVSTTRKSVRARKKKSGAEKRR
jgi:molybdate transport system regulatory protein